MEEQKLKEEHRRERERKHQEKRKMVFVVVTCRSCSLVLKITKTISSSVGVHAYGRNLDIEGSCVNVLARFIFHYRRKTGTETEISSQGRESGRDSKS